MLNFHSLPNLFDIAKINYKCFFQEWSLSVDYIMWETDFALQQLY